MQDFDKLARQGLGSLGLLVRLRELIMSETYYRLIAYRSDGVDTCRGCVVDEWKSEFEDMEGGVEEVIEAFANVLYADREHSYDTIILLRRENSPDDDVPMYSQMSEDSGQFIQLRGQAEKLVNDRLLKERLQREAEETKKRSCQEASEREELARLQAKYSK